MNVDLANVEEYLTSDKFSQFLLSTTTDFATAAFILQESMNALDRAKASMANEEKTDEKFYRVSEKDLLGMLASEAELNYLEAAGVDNWCGHGELRAETVESWGYDPDLDWEEIAELEIKNYEEI